MRFHVIALPHTNTTAAFSACAFTNKVVGFCKMMKGRGHSVFLYAGTQNEAPCDELVTCIGEAQRSSHVGRHHYTEAPWDLSSPAWRVFNANAIAGIMARYQPGDFICIIGGEAHRPIADAFPHPGYIVAEFGIGYGGSFARYKVFESYAWMHTTYGARSMNNPCAVDGQWFDAVIPGYLDPAEFPVAEKRGDYFLYVGRLIDRKGYRIAQEVCEAIGARLILAGPGRHEGYGEYVGVVGPEERGRLMSGARALFAPTVYIEPFGNVAIEAMACGTPVISTDWGAFTETNIHGVTGFRCRDFGEFMQATVNVDALDSATIRAHVVANYSLDVIGQKYESYFQRLGSLWGRGWYQGKPEAPAVAA